MASASDTQYDETRPEIILQNVSSNFQNAIQKDQTVTCSKWPSCVLAPRHVKTTTETHHICLNKTKETEIWDPGRWWKQKFNRTADAHVSNTLMLLPLQKLLRIKNVIQVFEGSKPKHKDGLHTFLYTSLLKIASEVKQRSKTFNHTCVSNMHWPVPIWRSHSKKRLTHDKTQVS